MTKLVKDKTDQLNLYTNLMWNFTFLIFLRKFLIGIFSFVLVLGILPQLAISQEIIHTYKITGKARIPVYLRDSQERSVEYDPASADHLYITDYRKNGFKLEKTQFLFNGEKFNLLKLQDYYNRKELLQDGIQNKYSEDEILESQLIFKADKLQQQTNYYPNGNPQMKFLGDDKALNGEFKMWYPEGQLSFSGNYKNSSKDGVFESFDLSGNLERKGIYQQGKLISGESVVQDLVYDKPNVAAQPIGGDSILNNYLTMKTVGLDFVKDMAEGEVKGINMSLTIGKTGHLNKIEVLSEAYGYEHEIISAVFQKFPIYIPALLEGAPVSSILNLNLTLSHNGLQTHLQKNNQLVGNETNSLNDTVYSIVEVMPEFPGGQSALQNFLIYRIKYPVEAASNGFQGKINVNFIVDTDGSITKVKVQNKIHPSLDAEAERVIRSMPKWIPGRQKGKAVRVSYTVPINFVLR